MDGNDLIFNDESFKLTHGLWKLLTIQNKKKMDKGTCESWWTKKDNFTEKDFNSYKRILMKIRSIKITIHQQKESLVLAKHESN